MCQDCREQGIARKIAQFEEPRLCVRGTRKRSEKSKGHKVRLDELAQVTKDFWQAYEWEEQAKIDAFKCKWKDQGHKQGPWMCWHGMGHGLLKSCTKTLDKIFAACSKDGII